MTSFLSIKGYARFFRVLSFFQAVSVTSLILSHLSDPVHGRLELIAYVLAWVEWPVMLLVIVPTIIRRLTFLTVLKQKKDDALMAKVIMQGKESLLRDFVRLIQLVGFERRASMEGGLLYDGMQFGRRSEVQLVLQGLKKFERTSEDEQREISLLFAAWDGHGIGLMETRELVEAFSTMGVTDPLAAVQNLIRLLDFDNTGRLSWMKFKALFGLAVDVPAEDKHLDLSLTYEMLDTDHDGELTLFELSDGFERMHIGIGLDDMANLLFLHFGIAKPFITRAEFVQWMAAVSEELM